MSRRQHTHAAGVSLFPFLDVLVCTMGSLILLLLVATSRIRAAAVERAKQAAAVARIKTLDTAPLVAPTPIIPDPEPESTNDVAAEWQTQIEQLTDERDSLRDQLARWQADLEKTQSTVLRTKVKAASAADRLQHIREQQQRTVEERARLQAEIDALQSDLTEAEERLVKAVERQKNATSQFAFLPFDGRTGTTKRPILLECTQEYVRFLPEDVRLSPADLNGFTSGFNPLLIASRELIHYWKAYDRVHEEESKTGTTRDADTFDADVIAMNDKAHEPYVLLLVRPNGAVAFHIAKSFLTQLKVPHGYELITDEMQIDESPPDPEAKKICQAAVAQVLSEREKVLQALARNRDQRQDQLLLEPTARTFVPTQSTDGFPDPSADASSARRTTNTAGRSTAIRNSELNRTGEPNRTGEAPAEPRSSDKQSSDKRGSAGASPSQERLNPLMAKGGSVGSGNSLSEPKRRFNGDEPPEERLPQRTVSRDVNDDTRPFPLTRGARPASSSLTGQESATPRGSSDPRDANPPAGDDPRAANGANNSAQFTKMKRRYAMPRAGIGLEKPIVIRVSPKRVLIGGQFEVPIDAGVRTESLIDRVLIAMDRVQSNWPAPTAGFHWVPTIQYEVAPGGEQVHQRLNASLFDLGLESSVKYLTTDSNQGGTR